MEICTYEIKISGIVQGVGFRPFVYNLAKSLSLNGYVSNSGSAVIIEVEGKASSVDIFIERLKMEAPPLSVIKEINVTEKPFCNYTDFSIRESDRNTGKHIYISPDVSICSDCTRELFNPSDKRYLYPFINCTNCGPRFTIVRDIPYDRVNTTMSRFEMCPGCSSEYKEPSDRRYHAQPVSCYSCGPQLILTDNRGRAVETGDILHHVTGALKQGAIVAVKGLGGYHLACDAMIPEAVRSLRERKVRDDKPFAIMVKDYEKASEYCHINSIEKTLLESQSKPIVLLKKRDTCTLPGEIAPGNPELGIMLPYTPLHLLLFNDKQFKLDAIVLTSGNKSSEPIFYKDEEALEHLSDIADYFLLNDREIFIRTDDSVTRAFRGREYIIRRSRGYVPMPVTCDFVTPSSSVLACGGELKNTFCINKGSEFYLSHHIGDLENAETLASFEQGIEHFKRIFEIDSDTIIFDMHPEYLSTKYALGLEGVKRIPVQHHHAHIASCMGENGLDEDVIGVAFDGTGYGEDGHIWGGEFFSGSYRGFKREGFLKYLRMPGGEMAIKEPWRMAVSYLYDLYGEAVRPALCEDNASETGCRTNLINTGSSGKGLTIEGVSLLEDVNSSSIATILKLVEKKINSPLTSSMGRLFDAVSALIGVRSSINYEGQAAIELEHAASREYCGEYGFDIINSGGLFNVCCNGIIEGVIKDIKNGMPKAVLAAKFHETAADIVLAGCCEVRDRTGLQKVVLSGGVFQNMTLLEKCMNKLETGGFKIYIHIKPPRGV